MSDTERRFRQTDPRLGRHVEHDERSRRFAFETTINTSLWRSRKVKVYDPRPNPNQTIGNCTGCAKAMMFNGVGSRKKGVVLGMGTANQVYSLATRLDAWGGTYPPEDTGSSGLAAAKAAQSLGLGGTYRFLFGGVNEVVQAVQDGHVVNVGTAWYNGMFEQDSHHVIEPTGGIAGGHEWTVRGYDVDRDLALGRCWWGSFKDFWISREHLGDLLADDGDAHVQERI